MVGISLMASAVKSPPILVPDQQLHRIPKELQLLLPPHDNKLHTLRSGYLKFDAQCPQDLWRSVHMPSDCNSYARPSSMLEKLARIDIQDSRLESMLFSFGIAEKCSSHEKIIKFLMSGSDSVRREGLDISLLSELMGLEGLALDMWPQSDKCNNERLCCNDIEMDDSQHLLDPEKHIFVPQPNFSILEESRFAPVFTLSPGDMNIFVNSEADTKDILSVIAEFNVPKTSTGGSKQSMLVPYFTRRARGRSKANNQVSSSKLETVVSPLKCPDNLKLKPAHKKKQRRKVANERDLYNRNYFHACESLLSFVLDKNKDSTSIISLKKSSPQISQLLTKFSAGIAGTGLALIFSVVFKVAYARVPLCSTRLLSTGFGVGLFWLSSSVSKLRNTIMMICKNSSKEKLNEEELARMVDGSMKEIMFRAAALVAVGVLRLA